MSRRTLDDQYAFRNFPEKYQVKVAKRIQGQLKRAGYGCGQYQGVITTDAPRALTMQLINEAKVIYGVK